jgi:hypothetical protein
LETSLAIAAKLQDNPSIHAVNTGDENTLNADACWQKTDSKVVSFPNASIFNISLQIFAWFRDGEVTVNLLTLFIILPTAEDL